MKKGAKRKSKGKKDSLASVLATPSLAPAQAEHKSGFSSKVLIAGQPGDDGQPVSKTEILLTDPEGETKSLPVLCLFCGTGID